MSPTPIGRPNLGTPSTTSLEPESIGTPVAENEDSASWPEIQAPHAAGRYTRAEYDLSPDLAHPTEVNVSTSTLNRLPSDNSVVAEPEPECTEFGLELYQRAQKRSKKSKLGSTLNKWMGELVNLKPFRNQNEPAPPSTLPATQRASSRVSVMSGSTASSIGGVVVELDANPQHDFRRQAPRPQHQESTALSDQENHGPNPQADVRHFLTPPQPDGNEGMNAIRPSPSPLQVPSPVTEREVGQAHYVGLGSQASM
ncbi:hypothetical protein BKA70DRAFT_1425561 [Coprinopsis sp. MPI-PUGE-AT-0042]|nr:hypothetical protein BKA70DRAFT_1425561 [Coprinopsis sp. MPI-PUGE-AT-0042]